MTALQMDNGTESTGEEEDAQPQESNAVADALEPTVALAGGEQGASNGTAAEGSATAGEDEEEEKPVPGWAKPVVNIWNFFKP